MTATDVKKLPASVKPLRYAIDLTPDLDRFTFEGSVNIEIEVVEATPRITLNAAELEIASAIVTLPDGRSVEASIDTDDEGHGTIEYSLIDMGTEAESEDPDVR